MLAPFQHGRHEPEVVIYHHLRHFADCVKSYFIASARDKSNGMYVHSVQPQVTHETDH